jgi:hypothetical protein
MKPTTKHLNDEHMRLYEWSGLGAQAAGSLPARSKRTHAWHASYGVLAVLTSMLILNGCDKQTAAEQASEQVGKAAQEQPLFDEAAPQLAPGEAAAPAAESMGEPTQPGTSEPAAEKPGQAGEAPQQP